MAWWAMLPGRRTGLEGVEKSLPAPSRARTRLSGTLAMLRVPHRRIAWSSWLLLLAPRRPGRGRRRHRQGGSAQLLGDDLDGRPGAAILGRPAPLLEATTTRLPFDSDPVSVLVP
jgi:hypothetical protein